jgi:hypothetical protein
MEAKHGHDDVVMSLALGAHLSLLPVELGLFASVSMVPSPPKPKPTPGKPYYDPFAEAFAFEE